MNTDFKHALIFLCFVLSPSLLLADITLPSIFGSHMVLQQNQEIVIWGWAEPGEKVTVRLADSSASSRTDENGNWKVRLPKRKADNQPLTMTLVGSNRLELTDILMGEVWICSGQSNMAWTVGRSFDADLVALSANYPRIRLISVPQVGTQEPQKDFQGSWERCNPKSVVEFSAVGFHFGRQIHEVLDVPVGLIDNAWGGSACEAWVRRDLLEKDERYRDLLDKWRDTEANFDFSKLSAQFQIKLEAWRIAAAKARKAGKKVPNRPRAPRNVLAGQHRPGNLYNGVLKPIIGLPIQGVIWYQGESNAGRAYQYRDLFPLMIQNWRDDWGIGEFAFYWTQLADFRDEKPEPAGSDWAELREAQTMSMSRLKNTGQAVIVDIGESNDIHPRNKRTVGQRLARWALAKQYGYDIVYQSPLFEKMSVVDGKVRVQFNHVGAGLKNHDFRELHGFTIATKEGPFVKAKAKIVGSNQVEVWSDQIKTPAHVRYAWADNPVCNLISREGLPATPFRTDQRKGVTADARK